MHCFKWLKMLLAALCLTVVIPALAVASISYYLDTPQTGSSSLTQGTNYLQVTISEGLAGAIDFEIDVLTDAFPTPLAANFGMDKFSFNYAPASLNVGVNNITNLNPDSWKVNMSGQDNGFGTFDLTTFGTTNIKTTLLLTFSITGVNNDTIESYAVGNTDGGKFFAAHVAGYKINESTETSATIAGSTPVPLPNALWLLGSGLVCLMGIRRRKNR